MTTIQERIARLQKSLNPNQPPAGALPLYSPREVSVTGGKYDPMQLLQSVPLLKRAVPGKRISTAKALGCGYFETGSEQDEIQQGLDNLIWVHRLYKALGHMGGKPYHFGRLLENPTANRIWNGTPGISAGIKGAFSQEFQKVMTTGGEPNFVISGQSYGLEERIWHMSALLDYFDVREIPMGTDTVTKPKRGAIVDAVLGSEATSADPSSGAITDVDSVDENYTLSPAKLERAQNFSGEMLEDQAYELDDLLSEHMVSHARAREDAIINGSDDGTHPDNDTDGGAATLAAKAFDGLVYDATQTLSNTVDNSAGTMTRALAHRLRGALSVDYAYRRPVLLLSHQDCVNLEADCDTNVIFSDASGMGASFNADARLAQFAGAPVVVSAKQRNTVAATGVNTSGGPNTFSRPLLLSAAAYVVGRKRDFTLDVEKYPGKDMIVASSTERLGFANRAPASENVIAAGINVALT